MKILSRILKYLVQFSSALKKVEISKALRLYDSKSDFVIVMSLLRGYPGIEILCWDLAAIQFCVENGIRFRLSSGKEDFKNTKILWAPSSGFVGSPDNYSELLIKYAEEQEKDNLIFPAAKEVAFLENKAFMHRIFEEKGVRTPKTIVLSDKEELNKNTLQFPLLLKGAHSSGSLDVHKIENFEMLQNMLDETDFLTVHHSIILQELLPIRRDLRVIFIGDSIMHFYWRINLSNEWKPTSTSRGSKVDFGNFPEQWRGRILDEFKKLGLPMGAFDVAWSNDDLNTEPYILEFSPRFTPNPAFTDVKKNLDYGNQKMKILGNDVYCKNQVELIFEYNKLYLSNLFRNGK